MEKQITKKTYKLGLRFTVFLFAMLLISGQGWTQPWTYDFGSETGSFSTSNTASTLFLPQPPFGGGDDRVRVSNAQGGSFNMENPGLAALGSNTELRIVAPTGGSVNKFSVYDYTAGKTGYLKFSVLLGNSTGGNTATSGTWSLFIGDGASYSDNNAFVGAQVFTGIRWVFGASGAITTTYRNVSSWVALGSTPPFAQGNVYTVEIYFNNSTSTQNYFRGTAQTVAANKQDIWVNGTLIGDELAKAQLPNDANIDSWMFYGESSTGNVANIFLDDFKYSNSLPLQIIPTISTTAISSIKRTTASSGGNITSDGGASITARGVCWSINPNPTIADNFTTNGTGTGSFTSSITGLTANTPYYVRAYATNSVGTAYGDELSFNTQKATETVSSTTNWSSLSNVGDETDVIVSGTLTVNTIGECGSLTVTPTGAVTINSGTGLLISGYLLLESNSSGTASLIHNNADISVAGATAIERYLPAWPNVTSTQGWHLLSSPVGGHSLTNFTPTPATSYDFFAWDEATNNWLDQKTQANNINQFTLGKGYLVAYENSGVRNFSGTINTADVNAPVTYTNSGPGLRGWNLVGNPYTSAIDVTYYSAWSKTNLTDYLYIWDDANGNYRYWNGLTGNLSVIPAMQGFWVRATATSPTLTIPASERLHSSQNFYKSSELANNLRIKVQSFNGFSDECFVYFSPYNTNGNDIMRDVPKLYGSVQEAPQIYTYIGSDKVSVNAMGSYANTSILMGFEPRKNGNFSITASELNSFGCGTKILLQDTKTNTTHDLTLNPTYNFTASTTDNVNRFVLHFDFSAVATNDINATPSYIFAFDRNIYINTNEQIKQINVYNTLGQLVKKLDNVSGIQKIDLDNNANGYYIVNVITNNNVITQKVLIK